MELYLLAELKTISLKVTTVDMQKPPPDFRTNFEATPPPILIDRGMAILENEKIERHIMKSVPGGHNLFVQVGAVNCRDRCRWVIVDCFRTKKWPPSSKICTPSSKCT